MFRVFCSFVAFVAGGFLAMRNQAVADFVNVAAVKLLDLFTMIKEALL